MKLEIELCFLLNEYNNQPKTLQPTHSVYKKINSNSSIDFSKPRLLLKEEKLIKNEILYRTWTHIEILNPPSTLNISIKYFLHWTVSIAYPII